MQKEEEKPTHERLAEWLKKDNNWKTIQRMFASMTRTQDWAWNIQMEDDGDGGWRFNHPKGTNIVAKYIDDDNPHNQVDKGIFKFGMKKVELYIKYWTLTNEPNTIVFRMTYAYSHFGGGSNGCDSNLRIEINLTRPASKYAVWDTGSLLA
tara:strand:+ start:148 stop:600 length:453 start_codon:yes stop_codon:yes gene_type:complete